MRQTCSRIATRNASWPTWIKPANTTSCPLISTKASASSLHCHRSVPSAIPTTTAATASTPLPTATTLPAQCLLKAMTTATTLAVVITRTAATLARVPCRRPHIRTEFRHQSEPPMRRSARDCSILPSRRAMARPATTTTFGSASKTIPNAVTFPLVCRHPVLPTRHSTVTITSTTPRLSTLQSVRLLLRFIRW